MLNSCACETLVVCSGKLIMFTGDVLVGGVVSLELLVVLLLKCMEVGEVLLCNMDV